jgi:uncharacterized membrane protein
LGRRGGRGLHVPVIGLYLTPAAIVIIVLVVLAIFFLPFSPTLRVTFAIKTTNGQAALTIVDQAYAKVSLFATSSTTKGNITLLIALNSQH